mmetsp:Transcript_10964/g.21468  ORF Transcript_10964/g.21468 Transcript_10964/m.21468 type:complete len:262 (-) Transcript_10964:32-817(-)
MARSDPTPEIMFSYNHANGTLHWTKIASKQSFSLVIPSFPIKHNSSWCAVPKGTLIFTGGIEPTPLQEVVSIAVDRDYSVSKKPSMNLGRGYHSSLYSQGFIYVAGGWGGSKPLSNCERFSVNKDEWEVLPSLPTSVYSYCMFMEESSQMLYCVGGRTGGVGSATLSVIQQLSVEKLEWRVLELALPSIFYCIPSFSSGGERYLVLEQDLYIFNPTSLRKVKTLPQPIRSFYGPAYYSHGSVFACNVNGPVWQVIIGELAN